jgi:hypothetical protein
MLNLILAVVTVLIVAAALWQSQVHGKAKTQDKMYKSWDSYVRGRTVQPSGGTAKGAGAAPTSGRPSDRR